MDYILRLNDSDMVILNNALVNLPYKQAAPLINKINSQIQEVHANGNNTDK